MSSLIKRLKEGDLSAFDEIYDSSKKAVYYASYVVFNSKDVAEDIMQETYLTLLEKKDKLKDDIDIVAFLTTIAKNKAFDLYRKRKKEHDLNEDFTPGDYLEVSDGGLLDTIKRVLNDKEYAVFLLKSLGDYSFKEIAKMRDIPIGTATWLYQEARKKLEKEVKING